MKTTIMHTFTLLFCAYGLMGCASLGQSANEQRAEINKMANATLQHLYNEKPGSQSMISQAAGYAVFDNAEVNVILASIGGGYGVAVSSTGQRTYMRMGTVGVGLGAGVKDFKQVMIFRDQDTFNFFVEKGWEFGGHADAAAKAGAMGAAAGGKATLDQDITVFQFTEAGLALQAIVAGTKYWRVDELNAGR
ncbi:hypothetical protein [Permianibacter aggregans]|uniref:Lipid-binding SYLF domain-containing protein n=1 Tax=Permianibacter aggregans TaxID=1510150 RepID=A0A4V3D687_9GAMM|nr:hypothetical protein [Permianibacter aggregans]QGX38888.1 hypothetical protein E2H98_04095 [Permianibacter aggregans]TDQ43057.1 lipid-binding SYLF domain-containing protein [Permianibacter aggregans]